MLSKQCKACLKAMANAGIQGEKGDKHAGRPPQLIHDPGIPPEPPAEPCGALLLPRVSSGAQQKCGTPRAHMLYLFYPFSNGSVDAFRSGPGGALSQS